MVSYVSCEAFYSDARTIPTRTTTCENKGHFHSDNSQLTLAGRSAATARSEHRMVVISATCVVAFCCAMRAPPIPLMPSPHLPLGRGSGVLTMEAGGAAVPEVVELVKTTLLAQRGFEEGAGVPLERLCDLVEDEKALAADDDFERVYDACDALEGEGWLRIANGKEGDDDDDDMLYLAATVEVAGPPLPPNAVVFDKGKHAAYDYAAEERATETIVQALVPLRRFGVDKQDAPSLPALQR